MKPRTRLIHPPQAELPDDNRALVGPIYQSVKFEVDGVEATGAVLRGARPGYTYTRASNPTTRSLELTLADLQGRPDAVAVGSGMAAVACALLALLKAGDHVLCFAETYAPTRRLIRDVLARYGVTHSMLSIEDSEGIERALAQRPTRLVWFESPTNPVLKIADIERLVAAAHRHDALAVLDNTFAGPANHGDYALDLYVHSLTKAASGHGDVMAGAVIGATELVDRVRAHACLLGPVLDPHTAFLVQRGLKTYPLRRAAQCESAARIAAYLAAQSGVARVHYPGLADHPGHALARRQMNDFGSVVSVDLKGTAEQARAFVDALELFALAASLGSTESLVQASPFLAGGTLSAEERRWSGITPTTTRLSIGIEDPDDLLADLARGLAAAAAAG
jgi:cystathionine beta-lyase/cystathionine gamma-synthase